MSVYAGPEIMNNGLVFSYDMGNTNKSWKGKPTTNVVTNPLPTTGWGVENYLTSSATLTFESENGIPHAKITSVVADTGYPRLVDSALTSTITDGFSASFEAKGTPGSQLLLSIYSSGSTKIQNTATLTNDWQRFTFNNLTTGFTLDRPYLRPTTTGATYYVRNIQIEQNTFSTPFVNGTRSSTQAIFDLVGNKIITIDDLSYSNNGTFSFLNNTGISFSTIDFSEAQTVEIWLKPLESDANRRNPYSQSYGGYGTWTHESDGTFNYYYGDAGTDGSPYIGHTSSFTVVENEIACICTTRDLNTSWWYKNGIQYNSFSHSFGSLATDNRNIVIGNGYAGSYYGNIYSVKLYNRALSAAEVKQNFNALRGRFGI